MDLKLCPRCNQLPDVNLQRRFLGYECVMHCNTLGCKLFWPIVVDGLNKEKVLAKASKQWNIAVDNY